jgi:hypothetical protein
MFMWQSPNGAKRLWLRLSLFGLIVCISFVLSACQKAKEAPRNYRLLASDVHVSVADHQVVLPFVALNDYGAIQSFSLNRRREGAAHADAISEFVREAGSPASPKSFDRLSIEIQTYGWNDADIQQRKICQMLTREWARSVCGNPWSAVQQALPRRFELVDLSRARFETPEPRTPRCAKNGTPRRAFPARPGETVILCELEIFGGKPGKNYVAIVRIDRYLGAAWSVWNGDQLGENAEAMAARQGKIIGAFVRYGVGGREDFSKLHAMACGLRAPNAHPGVHHIDCVDNPR